MNYSPRFALIPLLAMSVVLFTTGCPQSQDQVSANSNQAGTQDQASDPASANLVPVSNNSNAASPSYQQSAPPPDSGGSYDQGSYQGSDDPGYGEQPVAYADQPPPPLPEYDQPQAPGDDYLWTPGYWAWGQGGYYWVPGVWVEAPYEGALWTPGYWGYSHNRYGFYRGYWGPHIGYYGGVDYGFGYVGMGYQGGYWGGGHFNYNRSVNNINVTIVHNVYDRSVSENRGGSRVSFNGGSGGVQVRPRPAELAALHEQHAAPMRAQLQNEHAASTNRAQFASVSHGRPANLAVAQPLAADRNVRAPASLLAHNQVVQQQQQHQAIQQHQTVQQQQHQAVQQQQQHQAIQQPQQHQAVQQQHQPAPQPQQRQMAQQQQRQMAPPPQQRPPAQQQLQRQAPPPQRQAAPPPQQRQPAQQQQRQMAPPPQQRQPAQQQQRQAAPPPQQHQAPPPQRQAAPPQHQAAPPQHKEEEPPKR